MNEADGQVGSKGAGVPSLGSFDGIVQLLPMGVFRASLDGRLKRANPAFLGLLGFDPAGPVPDLDLGTVLRDVNGEGHVDTPGVGGTRLRGRVVVRVQGGGERVVTVTERLSGDAAGSWVDGLVEVRPEEADRQDVAQRFETIGRVSGAIAHDVNNLMTAIGGYASLLRSGLPEQDERQRDVSGILEATERCRDLVGRLLDAGRRGAGSPQVVDAADVVTGIQHLLERLVDDKGTLEVAAQSVPLPVRVVPVELEQILINLVTNARDALEQQGTIRLALTEQVSEGAAHVLISVVDDGAGMSSAVAERAFEPFFTTKDPRQGTGLGLSTVRSILERMGGEARFVSRPGGGTRVDVRLPRAGAE
jgi:signal transduction histidine kinase